MQYRIRRDNQLERGWIGMQKPRGRFQFQLRFWIICWCLMVVTFVSMFSSLDIKARQQQEQLDKLQQVSYAETVRSERLKAQLLSAETDSFREREARRRYGYVRPGTIRFIFDPGTVDTQPVRSEVEPETTETIQTQTDWSNFR